MAAPDIDTAAQHLSKLGRNSEQWWIEFPTSRISVARIFWKEQSRDALR